MINDDGVRTLLDMISNGVRALPCRSSEKQCSRYMSIIMTRLHMMSNDGVRTRMGMVRQLIHSRFLNPAVVPTHGEDGHDRRLRRPRHGWMD